MWESFGHTPGGVPVYIGIDIGGREGINTKMAIVRVEDAAPIILAIHDVPPRGDDFIVHFLADRTSEVDGVGIDSPFELPPCTRCRDRSCSGIEGCASQETLMIDDRGGNPYAERLTEILVSEALSEPTCRCHCYNQ